MAGIRWFLYGLLALLIGGCGLGQTVTETLHIPANAPPQPSCDETIVLLPFADYSDGDVATAHQRNLAISEALSDGLVSKGFKMPVAEDVFQYLVDDGIISLVPYGKDNSGVGSVAAELKGDWSDFMKDELRKMVASKGSNDPLQSPGTHGLDKKSIAAIGKQFNAAYVVRGRIIEYRMGKAHAWELRKKGLLPFVFGATSNAIFGMASSEKYDMINAMALGGIAGALVGNNASAPYEAPSTYVSYDPLADSTTTITSGTEDYAELNSWVWGVAGASLGYLAKKGGDTPQAIVQLRVWVQDTSTGEVVWTNRADVRVSPEAVYADGRAETLFDSAVQRAASALVDDFWNKTKAKL